MKKDDGIFWVTKQEFFRFYGTVSEPIIGEAGCPSIHVLSFPLILAETDICVRNRYDKVLEVEMPSNKTVAKVTR